MTELADAFAGYLDGLQAKGYLRFLTCGSVDDGKSTLIGRVLHDAGALADDQMAALERDSRRTMPDGGLDFSLLVDGLEAEREQGITIDVAYRYFGTARRNFIVADTPGHEQYTRNMVTGASGAELALLLVDARKGVLIQTRRHAYLCALMGITDVVLAVNKMDLVGYDQGVFETIVTEFGGFAAALGLGAVTAIPLSAVEGDNVLASSSAMPWYQGPALLPFLETVQPTRNVADAAFRLPVQSVIRPDQDFRGYAGTIVSGSMSVGQSVSIEPGGRISQVAAIFAAERSLDLAGPGQAVTVTLVDEVDISCGDVIAAADCRPAAAEQFAAHIVWMAEKPLMPGRSYLMRLGTRTVGMQVTEIKHRVNVNTLEHVAAKTLDLNDVAMCNLSCDRAVAFEPYAVNRDLGGFIIIDRITGATVGCGMIDFALRRSENIHWQRITVDKAARAGIKGQKGCVLWFTGLSGAGKSTVANHVEALLLATGHHTYLLDGDNVRHGLNRDLGFTEEDRVENIRRIGEVAKLFVDAGLIVLTAFISPFRAERRLARELVEDGEFIEIFVDAPLGVCEARDPKGLYKKAREGKIKNFTGFDSPYEVPERPEMILNTAEADAPALAEKVIALLKQKGVL